jgi:peptidoglycan/LPS O-acetylase OafA/YrhL
VNLVLSSPGYLHGLLEWRPLVWIGRISYGIYLWHYPVFKASSLLSLSWPLKLIVAVAATLAITSLSYYIVERPALSLKRKVLAGEQLS